MLPGVTSRQFLPYHARGESLYASGDTLDTLDIAPVELALARLLDDVIAR
jgi:hypothetical protein